MPVTYTDEKLLEILLRRIAESTQRQVAEELGVSRSFLNDVVHGRRNVTDSMVEKLGFKRSTIIRKVS